MKNKPYFKVWLDDTRPIPDEFCGSPGGGLVVVFRCMDIESVKRLYRYDYVDHISFDHDLGEGQGTGYDLAKWFEELAFVGKCKPVTWDIHSANYDGSKYIKMAMASADKFWKSRQVTP